MELREWLTRTTAAEVMVRNVVTLSPNDRLADAAEIFISQQITGAPVVDESGACAGVLSINDLVRADEQIEEQRRNIANTSFWQANLVLPVSIYEEKLAEVRDKTAPAAEQEVSRFMVSDLVSVDENASIDTVVMYMIDAHIHRVVVLGAKNRLVGIISTTDVLAAMMRAAAI